MVAELGSKRLSYEDFVALPEDDKRYELIDGDLQVTPAPATRHQLVVMNLCWVISSWIRGDGSGIVLPAPVDVVLSANDVVEPDVVYLSEANRDRLGEKNVSGPPDLAVEVLSEHHRRHDEIVKRHLYERFRVPEYWIVDPELETVKVHRLGDAGYAHPVVLSSENGDTLASPTLPGLETALADLFAN